MTSGKARIVKRQLHRVPNVLLISPADTKLNEAEGAVQSDGEVVRCALRLSYGSE
jgi:hypothetical protein